MVSWWLCVSQLQLVMSLLTVWLFNIMQLGWHLAVQHQLTHPLAFQHQLTHHLVDQHLFSCSASADLHNCLVKHSTNWPSSHVLTRWPFLPLFKQLAIASFSRFTVSFAWKLFWNISCIDQLVMWPTSVGNLTGTMFYNNDSRLVPDNFWGAILSGMDTDWCTQSKYTFSPTIHIIEAISNRCIC